MDAEQEFLKAVNGQMANHEFRDDGEGYCVTCGWALYRNREHGWELVHEDDCGGVLDDKRHCLKCGIFVDLQSLHARRVNGGPY